MRFSLATFMLVTLLLAALMAVWFWRQPWYRSYQGDGSPELLVGKQLLPQQRSWNTSPDGRRILRRIGTWPDKFGIVEASPEATTDEQILCTVDMASEFSFFVTDDMIASEIPAESNPDHREKFALYRRRFPEWWWGHFYRPEVWASVILFSLLIVQGVRSRKAKPVEPSLCAIR